MLWICVERKILHAGRDGTYLATEVCARLSVSGTPMKRDPWWQLFNGHISTQWLRHQHKYLKQNDKLGKYRSGSLWSVQTISAIWDQWYILWEARNGAQHGVDATTKNTRQREVAEAELRSLYVRKPEMMLEDRDLLFDTAEEHLRESTTSSLRNWLNNHRQLLIGSIAEAKRRSLQGVRSIRDYFGAVGAPQET